MKEQLTAYRCWRHRLNIEFVSHDLPRHLGESATRLSKPCCDMLAALLLPEGMSPLPRRALPATPHHGPLGRVQQLSQG